MVRLPPECYPDWLLEHTVTLFVMPRLPTDFISGNHSARCCCWDTCFFIGCKVMFLCNNGGFSGAANVVPSGGTPPYNVSWSNGDIGNSADSLFAGTYTVTIVDANYHFWYFSNNLRNRLCWIRHLLISPQLGGTNIGCKGDSTEFTVKSNCDRRNNSLYLFMVKWSNDWFHRTQVPTGSYTVTVTDNHGLYYSVYNY